MTPAMKVSACVDCALPIIGARPRCPVCHQRHAVSTHGAADGGAALAFLARWVVALELICIVVLGAWVVTRGCHS